MVGLIANFGEFMGLLQNSHSMKRDWALGYICTQFSDFS